MLAEVSEIAATQNSAIFYILVTINGILLALSANFLKELFSDYKELRNQVAEHESTLEVHGEKLKTIENAISKHHR